MPSRYLKGWNTKNAMRQINLDFTTAERIKAIKELTLMNITEESVFPGLDGFCQSLQHRLHFVLSVESARFYETSTLKRLRDGRRRKSGVGSVN